MINVVVDTRVHPLFVRPENERPTSGVFVDFIIRTIYPPHKPYSEIVIQHPGAFADEPAYLAYCEQSRNAIKAKVKELLNVAAVDIDNEENFRKIFTEANRITQENIASNICVKQWSTIGDLHASALKYFYFLLMQGIAKIDENPDEIYDAFRREYAISFKQIKVENEEDVAEAKASRATFDSNILPHIRITPGARVRDIGDDTGDRCGNEYMMLKLFELLIDNGANLEILLSNHGLGFILAIEAVLNVPDLKNLHVGTYMPEFGSVHRLRDLIAADVVTLEEIKALYEKYKKVLKAFSYDYNDAGQLVIYGHAPMNEIDILDIARHLLNLQTESEDITFMSEEQYVALSPLLVRLNAHHEMLQPEDIIALINHINGIVQYNADHNTLQNILCPDEILRQKYADNKIDEEVDLAIRSGTGIDPLVYGLHYATQNRDNPNDNVGTKRRADTGETRPKNPNVITGHGHDSSKYDYSICYDNILCKSKDMNVGVLNISLSHPNKPELVNENAPVVPADKSRNVM